MATIRFQELSFAYNGRSVLEEISLAISPGERIALLGPNGAGKTTLIKLISGVLPPSKGSIWLDGHKVHSLPRRDVARLIAVVPQEFVVPFAFTTQEIVELGRTVYLRALSSLRASDRRAIEKALALTDTIHLRHRIFNELSGGERQRVVIAMALAQEPKILLLDEPTQHLDITRQAEILDLVVQLNCDRGLTVLAAIHDLNLAAMYFSRILVLHRGTVIADGSPSNVFRLEVLEKAYEGPVNIFPSPKRGAPMVLPVPRFRPNGKE